MINDFIKELQFNQDINYKNGLENIVNIDYVIEKLEDIKKDINNYLDDRINFLQKMTDYACEDNKEDQIYEYSIRKFEVENIKNHIEGEDHEENN